jgi:UDP-N-acetylmuramate dehydrogenase
MNTAVSNASFKEWLTSHDIAFKSNVNLAARSHIKAGGIADLVVLPSTCEEVKSVICELKDIGERYAIIGSLSNVLFRDGRIRTPLLNLARLKSISLDPDNIFTVEAGVMMPSFARKAAEQGFSGLAGLVGVPGSVGGGLHMNASCYGSCMSDHLLDVLCIDKDGVVRTLSKPMLGYQWRQSAFHDTYSDYTIISARFSLPEGEKEVELGLINNISLHRKTYQEKGLPNLGSLFATIDIYSDLSAQFFAYKILLTIVKALCRLTSKNRDKNYAIMARRLTLIYFGLNDSPTVGFSESTFNCVVNRGDATADQIIEKIECTHKTINYCVRLENEIIKEIL